MNTLDKLCQLRQISTDEIYKFVKEEGEVTMRNTKNFKFDKRASSYDEGFEGKLSSRFYKLLLSQVELSAGATVLDVGCGTGTVLERLNKCGGIDGYGIDVEENMIGKAKLKCPQMSISVSDCTKTPFEDNKFDVITACMAYHHFTDRKGFAKEAARIIKHGGHLYITDPRFPWVVRRPLNLALKLHNIAGFFGTPEETVKTFSEYGFELVASNFDGYAQCVTLRKVS